MDNTELHYVEYDPDEIWLDIITKYVEAGGDVLYPGDEKEMLLRSVQADVVQIFASIDNALKMASLRYAIGEYLDIIGEQRGCDRIRASAATATVTITTNANGIPDVIEAGAGITTDGSIVYVLAEDFELTGLAKTETVQVIAEKAGNSGNGLITGAQMFLTTPNIGVNSIVAASDAVGGNDEETDDAYRERIREHGLASVTTGPSRQYEAVAKEVSSAILDAKALNEDEGVESAGDVFVYLLFASGTTGKAAIKSAVADALSAVDVRPLTDHVYIREATDVTYTLKVKYWSDNSTTTTEAIEQATEDYQYWQDNTIGRPFNPDKLMSAIYQAGATRVVWDTGSEFDDGGDVEYTEIENTERCLGTITLTAVTT